MLGYWKHILKAFFLHVKLNYASIGSMYLSLSILGIVDVIFIINILQSNNRNTKFIISGEGFTY